MTVLSNIGEHVQEYIWDFAVDGGATGTAVDLSAKNNKAVLPQNAIVTSVVARVIDAVVGASSTFVYGNTTDPNGYSGDYEEATLVADFVANGWDNGAALLWDDSNDHPIQFLVNSANDANFIVTPGTGTLTAGKVAFYVKYLMGSVNS